MLGKRNLFLLPTAREIRENSTRNLPEMGVSLEIDGLSSMIDFGVYSLANIDVVL